MGGLSQNVNAVGLDGVCINSAVAIIRRKTMDRCSALYSSHGQGGASDLVSARENSMLMHQSTDFPSHSGSTEAGPSANLKIVTPADLVIV